MILATPRSRFFNTAFDLVNSDGSGEPFGEVRLHLLLTSGHLTLGADAYILRPASVSKWRYALLDGDQVVAEAGVVGHTGRRFGVAVDDTELEMVTRSLAIGGTWELMDGDASAGTAQWRGFRKRTLEADFSDRLPLLTRAFVASVLVARRVSKGHA